MVFRASCLLLALFFSCQKKNTSEDEVKINNIETQAQELKALSPTTTKLIFPISEEISNSGELMFPFFKEGGKSYLSYYNKPLKEIIIFDVDQRTIFKRIRLDEQEKLKIETINGFHLKSLDSIYVCPGMKRVIYLINGQGNIIQTIPYRNDEFDSYKFNAPIPIISSLMHSTFVFQGNKIFLVAPLEGNWNQISTTELSKRRVCFELDTSNFFGKFNEFTFPQDYWQKGRIEPVFSRAYVDSNFVYSFFGDHNIYVTKDHVNVKRYSAHSSFFSEFIYPPLNPTMEEYFSYFCKTPAYRNLLYDKFRNVYYRFTSLGAKIVDGDNLQSVASNPPNVSIIILDSNFNKIGESVYRENKEYAFRCSIVLEDGLYISNGHPQNKNYDENTLSFTKFELSDYERPSL